MQNRSLNSSTVMSMAGGQAGPDADPNAIIAGNMSSFLVANSIIDSVIEKVNHIQFMKTLEKKVLPYTVQSTILQGLKVVKVTEIDYDHKFDDKYLNQDDDLVEPQSLGCDSCQSVSKVKQKDPIVQIMVYPDEGSQLRNRLSTTSVQKIKAFQRDGSGTRTLIGSDLNVRGKNKTVYQANTSGISPRRPLEEPSEQFLSSSAIAFHKKKPSFASQRVDESASEIGINSVSSHESNYKFTKNKQRQTLHSQGFYQAQVVKLEVEKTEEDLDEELQTKLAELRVEVSKRDIQRKFEAIQNSQTNRVSGGRKNAPGNPLMGGAAQNAKVTTDHEGKLIAVRSGAIAMTKPMQTTVTISKAVNSAPIGGVPNSKRRVTMAEEDQQRRQSRILSINDDGNDNRRGSQHSIEETEAEIQRAYMNQSAERILGNTVSSNFGKKKNEKAFANVQTVDYLRSIHLDQSQMSDGVAMINNSGSNSRLGTVVSSVKHSSNNLKGLSKISSRQKINQVQSVQNSAIRPPLSQHMDQQSFLSGPVNSQLHTPDANIRRSMQQVDYASPESFGKGGYLDNMNKQSAVYASDANLHQADDQEMMTNSLMSMQSRQQSKVQSKSMVRGRLGYGRIMTSNASEVASIIADSVQQIQSRQGGESRQDGSLYSVGPHHNNTYDSRGSSISRILGKQSSQKRLHDQIRGLSAQKNSESVSVIGQSPHKYYNLPTETSRIETDLPLGGGQRLGSHRPVASAINSDINSFSYLPSIQGAYRSKMQSGPSTDIVGRVRRRYGAPYPITGKSPLLMANHRSMRLDNGLSRGGGGIKMVDQARAKDLIHESSKEKMTTVETGSQNGGKRIRNLNKMGSREAVENNYVGESHQVDTESKPTTKTLASESGSQH